MQISKVQLQSPTFRGMSLKPLKSAEVIASIPDSFVRRSNQLKPPFVARDISDEELIKAFRRNISDLPDKFEKACANIAPENSIGKKKP